MRTAPAARPPTHIGPPVGEGPPDGGEDLGASPLFSPCPANTTRSAERTTRKSLTHLILPHRCTFCLDGFDGRGAVRAALGWTRQSPARKQLWGRQPLRTQRVPRSRLGLRGRSRQGEASGAFAKGATGTACGVGGNVLSLAPRAVRTASASGAMLALD